jgi:hypothetical protein
MPADTVLKKITPSCDYFAISTPFSPSVGDVSNANLVIRSDTA